MWKGEFDKEFPNSWLDNVGKGSVAEYRLKLGCDIFSGALAISAPGGGRKLMKFCGVVVGRMEVVDEGGRGPPWIVS